MEEDLLAQYSTKHKELPLLVRWDGTKAVGLFQEWKEVYRQPMSVSHTIFKLYTIPSDEFAKYYMCYVYDSVTDYTEDESIRESIVFMNYQRLTEYLDTLKEKMNSVTNTALTIQFYEELKKRRTDFHKRDEKVVTIIEKVQNKLDEQEENKTIFNSCIKITELHEELSYNKTHDLWTIFDNAKMNNIIPFCSYSVFYKMLESIQVLPEWNKSYPDSISVYVHNKTQYNSVFINDDNVVIQSKFQTDGNTPLYVIEMIQSIFGITLRQGISNQKRIQAICYLESKPINIKLFLLFIYQHKLYSQYLFAEESRVVMKDKTYVYCSYYPNPRRPNRSITFTLKNVSKEDLRRSECSIPGSTSEHALRIKIRKCETYKDIISTIRMLSLMISEYQADTSILKRELDRNRIEIPIEPTFVKKKSTKEKKIDFVIGSIRNQPNAPQRISIEDMKGQEHNYYHVNMEYEPYQWVTEELKNEEKYEDGTMKPQVLIFPKENEKYEDGVMIKQEQFFYICNKPGFQYADLRTFMDQQKDTTVLAPYCFSKYQDQNSKLKLYKDDTEVEEKVGLHIITTGKVLKPEQYGEALSWISRWSQLHLYKIDDHSRRLLRRGISNHSVDSILYVLECIKDPKLKIPLDEQVAQSKKQMVQLLKTNENYSNEIMSESYGYTKDQLIEQFDSGYIDPLLYYSFLCRYYKVNIIIFRKNGIKKTDTFYLSLPRYALLYTKSMIYPKTIAIAINQGHEFYKPRYPLCELIIKMPYDSLPPLNQSMAVWNTDTDWVNYIVDTEHKLYGKTMRIPLPLSSTHQTLDEYGNVSWLHTEHGSIKSNVPIHSQFLPIRSIEPLSSISLWNKDKLIYTIKSINPSIELRDEPYSDFEGISFEWNDTSYFLPYNYSPSPMLSDYKLFDKTSRYLIEYVCYTFSKYCEKIRSEILKQIEYREKQLKLQEEEINHDEEELKRDKVRSTHVEEQLHLIERKHQLEREKVTLIKEKINSREVYSTLITKDNVMGHIDIFATNCFIINGDIKDIEYIQEANYVNRSLDIYNLLYDGEHITIPNDLIRKKLMYVLINEFYSQKERLMKYHSESIMRNYYVHTWDYKQYPNHKMIKGEAEYLYYVSHYKELLSYGSITIRPTSLVPYLLYMDEPLEGCNKWIMQPVANRNEALIRYKLWLENKVNTFQDEEWENDIHFNQVVWKNHMEYIFIKYVESSKPVKDKYTNAFLSIIHVSDTEAIVQVMLPFDK